MNERELAEEIAEAVEESIREEKPACPVCQSTAIKIHRNGDWVCRSSLFWNGQKYHVCPARGVTLGDELIPIQRPRGENQWGTTSLT